MILAPINDEDCLGQLTAIARELVPTTLVQTVARRLGSRDAIVRWLQSLPQKDDRGDEGVRFIQCDVPQRARLLPDNPNCVERATGAMMLLEVVDPTTPRALATVDRPARHTGLVEQRGRRWYAVDLFPRRNFSWTDFGKDVLQGVHKYVGKPILTSYGLGGVADTIGEQEDKWIGRDRKKQPEKKSEPSSRPSPQVSTGAGAPASQRIPQGGQDAKATQAGHAGAATGDGTAGASAGEGNRRDPHDEGEAAQRFWWLHG